MEPSARGRVKVARVCSCGEGCADDEKRRVRVVVVRVVVVRVVVVRVVVVIE
jgi:hypothetical protein